MRVHKDLQVSKVQLAYVAIMEKEPSAFLQID